MPTPCVARTLVLALATLPALSQETPHEARRWYMDAQFHVAGPAGELREEVRGHLGLGFGLGIQARVHPRVFIRTRVEETGFRIQGDPSVLAAVADGMGSHFEGNREILRTWRLGADGQVFLGRVPDRGPFVAAGVAMQWGQYLYEWDQRENGEDAGSGSRILAARTAPSFTCALGWQWPAGGYLEARAATVEYSSPNRAAELAPGKGWILMLAFGLRL